MTKFLHFNMSGSMRNARKSMRKKFQSRTVAVKPLSAQDIVDIVDKYVKLSSRSTMSIQLNVGVTFLSLADKYVKSEGRQQAMNRMCAVELPVKEVIVNASHIFVSLAEYNGVALHLRLNKSTGFSTVVGELCIDGTVYGY